MSVVLTFFLLLGAVSAVDSDNVSIKEDSNLDDDVFILSSQLEISSGVSISETNMVNSQNDNLSDSFSVLSAINSEEDGDLKASNNEASDNNTAVLGVASKVPVNMSVINAVSDDSKTVFNVKLTDSENGKVLSGYMVNLILEGNNLPARTDENGIAQITARSLPTGDYNVTLKFSGSLSRYTPTTVNQKVSVSKKVPVKMTVIRTSSDDAGSIFRVKLIDGETGKALSGRKINFVINGQNLVGTTDKGGVAKITGKSLAKGDYTVTMSYAGSDYYAATTATQKVTINGVPVKMTVTSAVSDDSKTVFNVKLTDSENGKVLSGYMVNLILDGNNLPARTDENGIAQITTQSLQAGTYSVTLKFSGSLSRYAPTTVDQKVSVFKKVPVKMTVTRASSDNVGSIFRVKMIDGETGNALSGRKINFVINGQNLVGTTDKNGVAKITAKSLAKGNYTVTMSYAGSDYYAATTTTQNVEVNGVPVKMTVTSAVSDNSKTIFKVKLTDSEKGNVLSGYMVNLILDGNNLPGKTDENGIAQITAEPLLKGTYTVTLTFSGSLSRYSPTTVTQKVAVDGFVPVNMVVTSAVSDDSKTVFKVKLTDSDNGKVLSGYMVNLILDGNNLPARTDEKGIAQFTTQSLSTGDYRVTLMFSGAISRYVATTVNQTVSVFKKIPVKMSVTSATSNSTATLFKVKLTDSNNGNALSGYMVNLILQGKNYAGKTDNNGVAQITTDHLADGLYDVTLQFSGSLSRYVPTSISQKVGIGVNKVSLSNLVSASKNVKEYIEKNSALPSTVTIGGVSYTAAQYLYLASKAIYNLKNGDTSDVYIKLVDTPKYPETASNLGNLYDYYSVARRVANHGDNYNVMPTYAISDVGNIGYDGVIFAFARVLAFYGDHSSSMPDYVTIKSLSASSSNVNTKNTITNLAPYLAASTNCQVNNAEIKALAAKLTSGLTSDKDKAFAIYNYVRDSISYSFYYDTKYGAVGTLNAKQGNCVDQAHLLVALYRASNLPARYVHGTCYFTSSGSTYGHVWTQVLIGDTWTVGDPTSTRNSFGTVVNWNTNSYSLNGYYASISF